MERPFFFNIRDSSFRNDRSAFRSGSRSHLYKPVSFRQNLCIVINQQDGIAIGDQIAHDADQADDIGRMQSDGRFIQNIQNA